MVIIQCIDNRRLEVSRRKSGDYELRIMLKRSSYRKDTYIATLVIRPDEIKKLVDFIQ